MEARAALNLATPEDREIMLAIINGQSYDEIAAAHNISKMEITRRMRKYGAMLRGGNQI